MSVFNLPFRQNGKTREASMQQLMQLLLYSTGPIFSACNNMYTHDYNMSQKLSRLHVNVGTYETPQMVCQSKKRKDQCIATAMSLNW